jgi:cytosine/adenosine deaminase-related metal-dependent hydrolase
MVRGDWVIAFDGASHVMIRDGGVVYEGDRILWVGKDYDGPVDRTLGGPGKVVFPGLINMHNHAGIHTGELVVAEAGRPDVFNSGVLSFLPTYGVDAKSETKVTDAEYLLGSKFAFCEMLKGGATTIVEAGSLGGTVDATGSYAEGFADIVEEVGFRAYIAPGFNSESTYYDEAGRIIFVRDDDNGFKGLERAARFIEQNAGRADGRVQGMLFPNIDLLCTKELLQETVKVAEQMDLRVQTHCAEALLDHHESLRRHRMSLVEYLADAGFLGPRAILGHALYTSEHPWAVYQHGRDLDLIVESGSHVVHATTVFARRGVALHSYQKYVDVGVNVCLGTDTYPMDLIMELRHAAYVARVVDEDYAAAPSRALFNSVTINAAKALGRDDLGRLAPGAKADIVVLDFDKIAVGPYIDPIRALVNCGSGRDVETIVVDGEVIAEGGRLTRVDEDALLAEAKRITGRDLQKILEENWPGKRLDEVAPPSFPVVETLGRS